MKGTRYEYAARGWFRFFKSRFLSLFSDTFFVLVVFAAVFVLLLLMQSLRMGLGL